MTRSKKFDNYAQPFYITGILDLLQPECHISEQEEEISLELSRN